jgi:hypothetical protein
MYDTLFPFNTYFDDSLARLLESDSSVLYFDAPFTRPLLFG